jgi:hypothetical protein
LHQMNLRKVSVPSLTPGEMADLVAYLRSFQYFGAPGNVARGRQLLVDKRCVQCHSSPSALQEKGLDSPAAVTAALWNHGGEMVMGRFQDLKITWPQISADDISHIAAFFARTRSER